MQERRREETKLRSMLDAVVVVGGGIARQR
jgi:hypothetical protein